MPQARGTETTVALIEESAYGVTPGSPVGTKFYVVSSALRASQNLIRSNTLTATRARAKPSRGNISVAGQIQTEISAENIGTILKHAMGGVTTTGAGPYTHTYALGSLPVGMQIEHDHGSAISGAGRYELFSGVRVASMTIDLPTEGMATIGFDLRGAGSELTSSPADATLTDNGHTPFSSFEAVLLEGGSSIATVTQVNLQLSNELDESLYAIGGGGRRRALTEGFSTVTGTITAMFESAALLNKAINGTTSSLRMTLSRGTGNGSAGNEFVEFFVESLLYQRTSPGIDGPQGLMLELPFESFLVGGNPGFSAVVKNAVATV